MKMPTHGVFPNNGEEVPMHLPTDKMGCFTQTLKPRPWLSYEHMYKKKKEPDLALMCNAWASREMLVRHQGTLCDLCARLPEALRPPVDIEEVR